MISLLISLYLLGGYNMWHLVDIDKNYERLILALVWPALTVLQIVVTVLGFLFDE